MKQILSTFVFVAIIAVGSITAQNQIFKKGNINYSLGLGVVPTFFADNVTIKTPPVNFRLGYNISNNFNLNAAIGYSASTSAMIPDNFNNGYRQYNNKFLMLGLRGELHAMRTEKLDIYGGFMLGYNKSFIDETFHASETEPGTDAPVNTPTPFRPEEGKMLYSGFIGATYFMSNKLGIYAELGYGVSLINVGVTFKI